MIKWIPEWAAGTSQRILWPEIKKRFVRYTVGNLNM